MADRSVKVKLTLDAKGFIAGLAAAEAAAKKFRDGLGKSWEPWDEETKKRRTRAPKDADEVAGAFARSFSSRLESAFRKLPKAKIDADSSDAQAQLQSVRSSIQELSSKTIGVDINTSSALGELRALQMELARLGDSPEIDVRADAAAALTELRALQRQVDALGGETAEVDVDADAAAAQAKIREVEAQMGRLNGKTANVNIGGDASGALSAIALVSAALASLPAVATIGLAVGGLGAAFTAAGAGAAGFAAAALPGLGRVNDAVKEAETATGGAGGAVESLAQKQAKAAASALQLAQAQDRVKDAQRGVQDAVRGVARAQEDAAQAAQDAADRQASAARRIEDAERSVADAHRATQRAVEDLTRAREQARERLEDLALATDRGALSEERAQIALARAKADAAKTNANKKATALDKQDANLRVREAEQSLKEIQERNKDLAQEQAKAATQGVEGSDEVKAAKDRVEDATRREQDAERDLADARAQASRVAVDGAKQVADANERVADAQRKVTDSQRDLLRAQQQLKVEQLQAKAAMEQHGAAAGGAATKMSKLSAEEKKLADKLRDFKDTYQAWQESLQPDTFPVIAKGMDLLVVGMHKATPLVRASAGAFGELIDAANRELKSEQWSSFFDDLTEQAPRAIEGLGAAALNVAGGLAGIVQAFLPLTDDIMGAVEDITQAFEDWGQHLGSSGDFRDFVAYARENLPQVWELLKNVAAAGVHIVESLSPLGVGALGGLNLLASIVKDMEPEHIQAIVAAFLAFKAVQGALAGLTFFNKIKDQLSSLGGSADTAKGKLAAIGKIAGIAGIAGGVLVAAGAIHELSKQAAGANITVDGLASAMSSFGKTGRVTGELADAYGKDLKGAAGFVDGFGESLRRSFDPTFLDTARRGFTDTIKNMTGGLADLDPAAEKLETVDRALASLADNGDVAGAQDVFRRLAKEAGDAGIPLDALKELLPEYAEALGAASGRTDTAADAMNGMAGASDDAREALDDYQKSIDTFTSKTDAAQALRDLKKGFDDVQEAVHAANGKLDISSTMTAKQMDATLKAREAFGGYLGQVDTAIVKVGDLAVATGRAASKSVDQKLALADVLPKLFDLAGKSKDAQEQVFLLAQKFGISRDEAVKARDKVKDFKEWVDRLKSKKVSIDADTSPARGALESLLRTIGASQANVSVGVLKKNAAGAVMAYAAGGVEAYAAGGRRSTPPQLAASPTILFGEGRGREYFIPTDPAFRSRAVDFLSQAAAEFGMQLMPAQGVLSSVQAASSDMQRALGTASSTLSGTLGASGSVTTTLVDLGGSADDLAESVGSSSRTLTVTIKDGATQIGTAVSYTAKTVTSQVALLKAEIVRLEAALAKAQAKTSASSASKAPATKIGTAISQTKKPQIGTAISQTKKPLVGSSINPDAKAKAKAKAKNAPGFVEPLEARAAGGLFTSDMVLVGEAGREMAIPLDPSRRARGLSLLHQTAGLMGQRVIPRQVSQTQPRYTLAGSGRSGGGQLDDRVVKLLERIADQDRSPAQIGPNYFPEGTDGTQLLEQAYFKARVRRRR